MQKIYDHRSSIKGRAEEAVAEHMALKLAELKTPEALGEYASWLISKEEGLPFLYRRIKTKPNQPEVSDQRMINKTCR